MSEEIKWRYLPAEKDLAERIKATEAEHYVKPNPSVVVHWGIASRVAMLKAIYQDQKDGLHSLIGHGRCSCGLEVEARIESLTLALLKSEHHRNHRTLKPEIPVFRGMVGKRLFALNSSQNSLDQTWDELVLGYAAGSHSGIRFIPSAFTAIPNN
ncbi:MAG: hypothetical protein RIQ88_382 [Actinomycetota bacterium]|jgi:hypothetical protein